MYPRATFQKVEVSCYKIQSSCLNQSLTSVCSCLARELLLKKKRRIRSSRGLGTQRTAICTPPWRDMLAFLHGFRSVCVPVHVPKPECLTWACVCVCGCAPTDVCVHVYLRACVSTKKEGGNTHRVSSPLQPDARQKGSDNHCLQILNLPSHSRAHPLSS